MKNKKKLIIAVIAVILALSLIGTGIYFYLMRYNTDEKDTEELYRQNVASVAYENTIETAYPQTDLYDIIKDHFEAESSQYAPAGRGDFALPGTGYFHICDAVHGKHSVCQLHQQPCSLRRRCGRGCHYHIVQHHAVCAAAHAGCGSGLSAYPQL